jgi:acyl dehydratase
MTEPGTERLQPNQLAALIGQEIGTSAWIAIDQTRINQFAHCTGDMQWIHVDEARCIAESPFGAPVAHGFLTLSLLAAASSEVLMSRLVLKQAVNYGVDKVRFLSPVRVGSRVRYVMKVAAVEDKGAGRTLLTLDFSAQIEGAEKPALVGTSMAMLMG